MPSIDDIDKLHFTSARHFDILIIERCNYALRAFTLYLRFRASSDYKHATSHIIAPFRQMSLFTHY